MSGRYIRVEFLKTAAADGLILLTMELHGCVTTEDVFDQSKSELEEEEGGGPVSGHLAERHLADRTIGRQTFGRQTFGRQDIWPTGHLADRHLADN